MRILGIDPGIATVGFGVVDTEPGRLRYVSCGVITTPAHTALSARLDQIYTDLQELFDTFRPEQISIEELFFSKNITTGISVAHGRGVILLAAYQNQIPVYEYTPMQVKQSVVGYGLAEKRQVIDMVRRILQMPAAPKPDDAADAVALAICHARSATSLLTKLGGEQPCSTI
ncbi:MAG: crossover junction endodeoxyribonuclease RuvC [Oscillospiraceae bacterium]|nr:crossover junction endodeoxyribonuclease RuvC [Oscillospiraceae bacterium]